MSDVIRERQYVVDGRRADDIEVHERRWWQSNGLLLALLGLLALAVIAIFLYDRGRSARAPVIEPTLPRVEAPAPDVRAPVLAPPPPPADEGAPAMAPPPPPEEQSVTPPMVPVPAERDATKEEEKKTEDEKKAADAQKADADKQRMTAEKQTEDEKKAADAQKADADKQRMTAEKQAAPAQTKPQQPGQTGQRTTPQAPMAATPAAPGAAAAANEPWAAAASGNGCQRLDIYFNPQSMKLTDAENQKLDRLAECLKKHPGTVVKFEGRSDGVELSASDKLGKDRAQLIADELEERGIKECRFVVVNAERSCTQNDFACRRQNRSVSVISDF